MKGLFAVVLAAAFFAAAPAWGSGKDTFEKKCTKCHGASKTLGKKAGKDYWQPLVQRMQKKRSNYISDSEAGEIVAFLAESQGPK